MWGSTPNHAEVHYRHKCRAAKTGLVKDCEFMSNNGTLTAEPKTKPALKLDFGCGPNPKEGFEGVDQYAFDGKVKHVRDIRKRFQWKDNSVDEAHSAHFVEHLTAEERCHFFNELWRVLKPGAKATIITPHWCSTRAYGDPTHQWPPVSEMFYLYLQKPWRESQAPHTDAKNWEKGYCCDFEGGVVGYNPNPLFQQEGRNATYIQFAMNWYKEAAADSIAIITKKP